MRRNILIVESQNDKYFFQSFIKHLSRDIEVEAPIFNDNDYLPMNGLDEKKLTETIKNLKAEIQKGVIERVGIIIDIDLRSESARVKLINDCIKNVFPNAPSINKPSQFIDLSFADNEFKLTCYFTNVDGKGELETVLKIIKSKESIHADCLATWRECLESKGKTIKDKDFDKFWIDNYVRFDTCSNKDKTQAGRKCNLNYALQTKTEVWNFDHPVLSDLKSFFELFS